MPTVFSGPKTKGKKQQVCDASCYGAIHIECKCICGGVNHGVGLWQAIRNVNAGLMPKEENNNVIEKSKNVIKEEDEFDPSQT